MRKRKTIPTLQNAEPFNHDWLGMDRNVWARSHWKKKRTLLISPGKHRIKVGTRGLPGDKCCKAM